MIPTQGRLKPLLTFGLLGGMALMLSACNTLENKAEIPSGVNMLVIIADDAGWNDVGYNRSEIQTPNIDWLASNGVQLQRFYVSPTCSPSRVALLTGMPSSRIGIVAPISGKSKKTLPDSITTLPQALKKLNYQTALFGKWHLGLELSNGPNAFGFDYSYGFLHGQIDQYTHRYKNGDASWFRNLEMIEEEGHTTDLLTKETINWLSKKRDPSKNFYVQLAYSAPHFPLQEEAHWKAAYENTIPNSSRRDFAAAMSHMDHAIGQVLERLKQLQLEENTLVLFMSDNGAMESWLPADQYEGSHGPNPVLGSNWPLRDWKGSNYEGAIRVPAVVYWKNRLKPHANGNYMAITDVMPTLLSLLDAEIPKHVEGTKFWPSLQNPEVPTHHDIYIRGHVQESLIRRPWKLVRTRHKDHSPASYQLFDIEADPEEQQDIIDQDPELTANMKALLEAQFAKDAKQVNLELQ